MIEIPLVDTDAEQLTRWLAGERVHVRGTKRGDSWRCCPDFSCCRAELLAPLEQRQAFVDGDEPARAKMAMKFLARVMLMSTSASVLITDGETHVSVNPKGHK
jgi:hypothetical protein